jgi:hypothetical protein
VEPAHLARHSSPLIPPKKIVANNLPLGQARKLIINIPVDLRGKIDIYIDDTTGLTVNVPGTDNATCMEAAIPLTIEVAARPNDPNEHIHREPVIARNKLTAEGGLSETKMIVGWLFNFRTLIISLPDHKFIAWTAAIQKMVTLKRTTSKDLETTIGGMGHMGFVIPWVHHFLSRLRSLHFRPQNCCFIIINKTCIKDLELMTGILTKAYKGIDMNLLAFHAPDRVYHSDSCPAGLGGYSNQGHISTAT